MKTVILIIVLFYCQLSYSQSECYFIDSVTNLVYNKTDSLPFTGDCNKYFKNGKTELNCYYENGIIKTSKSWNKNGTLIDSTIYLEGELKFEIFMFYESGKIKYHGSNILKGKVKTFLYGKIDNYVPEGRCISYSRTGNIECESHYVNGELNDTLKMYYENGNLYRLITYKNGLKHGSEKYYYNNGLPEEERKYENGKLINPVRAWNKKGNEFEVIYFIDKTGEGNREESRKLIE